MIEACTALEEMWKDGINQGVDTLIEIIQKLRNGESVEDLKKSYDEEIIQKALSVK